MALSRFSLSLSLSLSLQSSFHATQGGNWKRERELLPWPI